MGFRINNNIAALVTQGNLAKTQSSLSTSIERLSSGLRINRGADDAAGLTISEKLRGQIRGLNRATANAQDGISLIQTAEGALNEDASILNRLRELSIQSMEDGLTSNDRLEIQKEVDQLVDEIDRISKTTEFNTKKLLDGTASALVSTNDKDLKAFQTGDAGKLSAGDYSVAVRMEDSGIKQVQKSGILTNKENGNIAGLTTQLKNLSSFYDNDGNLVVDKPKTVTLRGNGQKVDVTISSDMTLEEFSNSLEDAIVKEITDGGLGLKGSTFAFDEMTGQIIFESGRSGQSGEVAISTEENIIKALGFQITTESEAAAYKVSATQTGVNTPKTTTANTTTDRASGVIQGLDLRFELSSEARVDGTIAGVKTIDVASSAIIFTIHDTNATDNHQNGITNGVTINLTANRSFSVASIETIVNNAIADATNPNSEWVNGEGATHATSGQATKNPGITASFDGYNLVLTSSDTGTSASISVAANTAAQDILGIYSGKAAGSSGTAATLTSTVDISNGITIGTTQLKLYVSDGDFNFGSGTSGAIMFAANTTVSKTSILDAFNSYFSANNVKAQASMTSDGYLEIRSTEAGTDARVSIFNSASGVFTGTGSLSELGFTSGENNTGTGGNAAIVTGKTRESSSTIGYQFTDQITFSITDKSGTNSGSIRIGTAGVVASEKFTISKERVASLIDASSISNTDVSYKFDAGGRLDFYSRSAGENSRIVLNLNIASDANVGSTALGIDFSSATQGSGKTEFDLHVADRSLKFQIGANKSQILDFAVINTSAEALGLNGLDITNVKSATRALGLIDDAVNVISSERSKLGSLQNRLTSTINNLTVTSNNLQSTESKIRDVDVAKETIEFTRANILIQAGTAQLAQAKGLTQGALQLMQ